MTIEITPYTNESTNDAHKVNHDVQAIGLAIQSLDNDIDDLESIVSGGTSTTVTVLTGWDTTATITIVNGIITAVT